MSILKDGLRLAKLKRSIGRDHADPRPLLPIQVATYLKEMKEDLNDLSNVKTAKRLGVSTALISNFLSLLDAPTNKYDYVWGWGTSTDARLAWSMCRRMGIEYKKGLISEEEFGKLVSGALNNQIPPKTVEDILILKKRYPEKSFNECCKEILNLIPESITSIIFIADLDHSIIEKIHKKSISASKSEEDIAESILSKYIGQENIEGVLLKNNKHIKIAFTEKGREKLDKISKQERKSIVEIINYLFLKEGF